MSLIERFVDSKLVRVGIEAIFIGGYTLILYVLIGSIIEGPIYIVLFLLGCIKHASGYFVGLHDRYCHGCSHHKHSVPPTVLETVGEGVVFLIAELAIHSIFTNIYINIFVLGALLHIAFELFGLHRWFCITHCVG